MPKNDSTAVLVKNAEQIDDVIYVGVDDGHAEIKIVTSNGLKFKMPSKAVDGRQIVLMNDGNLGFDLISIMGNAEILQLAMTYKKVLIPVPRHTHSLI